MFQSFYTSLSGLFSFSRALDNVSNNVANMNTPGFRGSDSFMRSLNGGESGFGATIEGTGLRTGAGELRETGNSTDLAINGQGMFILESDSGELFYSRAGQFRFNDEGILVDSVSGFAVKAVTESGNLVDITIDDSRILAAEATTLVEFNGSFDSSATDDIQIAEFTVFAADGSTHALTATLSPAASGVTGAWDVEIKEGDTVLHTGEVRFATDGTPVANFNSFDASLTLEGAAQTVTFNFGEAGTANGVSTVASGGSGVSAGDIDGRATSGLTTVEFDADGQIQLTYSNGETEEGQHIALAFFSDETQLTVADGSLYRAKDSIEPTIGQANTQMFGTIQGGSLELSNVDITQEFADLLIVQRGYQASSRIMNVANEMVDQLYNLGGRG